MDEPDHEPRSWPLRVDLGDEVVYRGQRWMIDDERLKSLDGQGDLRYDEFDLRDLEPATGP